MKIIDRSKLSQLKTLRAYELARSKMAMPSPRSSVATKAHGKTAQTKKTSTTSKRARR